MNLLIEQAFTTLLYEQEIYVTKGSGYVLESIDGLLLTVGIQVKAYEGGGVPLKLAWRLLILITNVMTMMK